MVKVKRPSQELTAPPGPSPSPAPIAPHAVGGDGIGGFGPVWPPPSACRSASVPLNRSPSTPPGMPATESSSSYCQKRQSPHEVGMYGQLAPS